MQSAARQASAEVTEKRPEDELNDVQAADNPLLADKPAFCTSCAKLEAQLALLKVCVLAISNNMNVGAKDKHDLCFFTSS